MNMRAGGGWIGIFKGMEWIVQRGGGEGGFRGKQKYQTGREIYQMWMIWKLLLLLSLFPQIFKGNLGLGSLRSKMGG